ncbi:hypothetical protein KEM60_00762 [Austwickia sp. TVS 96-490-7B]|uniref:hypothetical protein n=1 Tax=Austwickia sp. TVS 96-490-7B TaxID=2830843 RepID=UPI001C560647|nr:hypothetical protein [Austwickia sp. TVS 96-490-7B]MBW3084574.1 hypothetical protein [Austwickia sp. TVS 96-490-7B]
MSTTTAAQRSTALQSLRHHGVLAVLVTVLSTVVGTGVAVTRPDVYTGETRLAIGKGEMSALNIPGYPSAAKEMASNYSRWVTDQGVSGLRPPAGVSSLVASPIPDSSIIRIEAKADSAETAVKASQQAADALVAEVAKGRRENDPKEILKEIVAHAPELSKVNAGAAGTLAKYNRDLGEGKSDQVIAADLEAYAKVDTERARLQVEQDARLERYRRLVSTSSTEADLRTIGQGARLVGDNRASRLQRGALIGVAGGMVISLCLAVYLDRRRRRERG